MSVGRANNRMQRTALRAAAAAERFAAFRPAVRKQTRHMVDRARKTVRDKARIALRSGESWAKGILSWGKQRGARRGSFQAHYVVSEIMLRERGLHAKQLMRSC